MTNLTPAQLRIGAIMLFGWMVIGICSLWLWLKPQFQEDNQLRAPVQQDDDDDGFQPGDPAWDLLFNNNNN